LRCNTVGRHKERTANHKVKMVYNGPRGRIEIAF
jgi:hypothetical protein